MMKIPCLAKAYGDRPLHRHAVGRSDDLIYVANPSLQAADQEIALRAVGFPKDAVFAYDAKLLEHLNNAFSASDSAALVAIWDLAQPLAVELPEMDSVVAAAANEEAAPG